MDPGEGRQQQLCGPGLRLTPTPKRGRPRAPEWERRLLPQETIPPKRLRTSDSR